MKIVKVAAVLLVAALCATASVAAQTQQLYPPWHAGDDDPATVHGLDFTVPEADTMVDFHGSINDPKLVIFVAGNYYFAMGKLVKAFELRHPEYRGKIFYVTIPPGLLVAAMRNGDTFTSGNMTFTVHPDVYAAGKKSVDAQIASGRVRAPRAVYATNDLTIMVPKENPAHIASLSDLGKPGVRLVMPNPLFEGVARQIQAALKKAGGQTLVDAVYKTKVNDGETTLTHIHHRQTPLALMEGRADAGVTWKSEAIFQEQIGHPIAHVDIPADDNVTAIYAAALVRNARHPQAGKAWVAFLQSRTALSIFSQYGFKGASTVSPALIF